jgi:hypothetical protein
VSWSVVQAKALHSAVLSVPKTLGIFDKVNGHQPKNPPGQKLSCHVWIARWRPARSGLNSTSVTVVYNAQVQLPADYQPADDVEPLMLSATLRLAAGYAGGFTLGGNLGVRAIDLRGMEGVTMEEQQGFLTHDQNLYRAAPVVVPIILNHVLAEVP